MIANAADSSPTTVCPLSARLPVEARGALTFGFPTVLVWGKPQSVIGVPIDLGNMVEGSKDVLICCASQGGFDTSTVSSSAGGGGLGDVGAGTKYA